MLIAVPSLTEEDSRVIADIDVMRQRLRHQVGQPSRWVGPLRRSLTARAVQGSNSIEGYGVSVADAEALVSSEAMSADIDADTRAAVTGYCEALTWVQQSALMDNFSYHEMMLSTLHFMMLKQHINKWPGRYRPDGIFVVGTDPLNPVYTGPDADQVPALMVELVDWLNAGDLDAPALVRAAMAHLNLVSIHPWKDGNGRMSRCVHTLVLAREQILAPEFSSIEEWLGHETNTHDYYHTLREVQRGHWRPDADARPWVRFCLRAHHQQIQSVEKRLMLASRTWSAIEELTTAHRLDERMTTALYAATGGRMTRVGYQNDEGLTRDQAVRDIQALKRIGLIESAGHARTQHYTAAGEARAEAERIFDEVRRIRLRDPYRP